MAKPKKSAKRKAKSKRKSVKKPKPSTRSSTPTLMGKKLNRSPVALSSLQNAAELGTVLEVEAGGKRIKWNERKKPAMLYAPTSKTLFWYHGPVKESTRKKVNPEGQAARLYSKWTGNRRTADYERNAEIPDSTFSKVVKIGPARMIAYRSDKFAGRGKPSDYEHELGPGVSLYKFGGTKPPWVFVLRGGRMTVTKRGIVG